MMLFNAMLGCMSCHKAMPITRLNFSPEFHCEDGEYIETAKNDMAAFHIKHQDHQVKTLKVIKDSYLSDSPYGEPITLAYFEAVDSENRNFVITMQRQDINQPRQYKVQRGWIKKSISGTKIQEQAIKKQIKTERNRLSMPDKKIDVFISCLSLMPEMSGCFEKENICPTTYPLIDEVKLSQSSVEKLLKLSKTIFDSDQMAFIEKFVKEHLEDVLILKIKYEPFVSTVDFS